MKWKKDHKEEPASTGEDVPGDRDGGSVAEGPSRTSKAEETVAEDSPCADMASETAVKEREKGVEAINEINTP